MQIQGKCHCGNIRYTLEWPGDAKDIKVRVCGCTFCVKHGGSWTSHREARLNAQISDASLLSKYNFGHGTGDFHVCARCGVVPFVTSSIDDQLYAVVNINAFENIDVSSLERSASNFDGEEIGDRLERRKRNWIPNVRIAAT
jgi:hypothetical protein